MSGQTRRTLAPIFGKKKLMRSAVLSDPQPPGPTILQQRQNEWGLETDFLMSASPAGNGATPSNLRIPPKIMQSKITEYGQQKKSNPNVHPYKPPQGNYKHRQPDPPCYTSMNQYSTLQGRSNTLLNFGNKPPPIPTKQPSSMNRSQNYPGGRSNSATEKFNWSGNTRVQGQSWQSTQVQSLQNTNSSQSQITKKPSYLGRPMQAAVQREMRPAQQKPYAMQSSHATTRTSFNMQPTMEAPRYSAGYSRENKSQSTRMTDQKQVDNSLRVVTTTVCGLKQWSRYKQKLNLLFEVFGILDSAIMEDRRGSLAKVFRLKHVNDTVQCVFYEIDRPIPRLIRGQWQRCMGNMDELGRFRVVSARAATFDEQRCFVQEAELSDSSMRELACHINEL